MQFGQLIAEMPDLTAPAPVCAETQKWLGRAVALIEATGDINDGVDALALKAAIRFLRQRAPAQN